MNKDSKLIIEKYKNMAETYFNKINYQTIKFMIMEVFYGFSDHKYYLSSEKSIRKYFLWQSRSNPSDVLIKHFFTFDHLNDLTWNECLLVSNKYRENEEKKQEELKNFNNISAREMYKDCLDTDPFAQALVMLEDLNDNK